MTRTIATVVFLLLAAGCAFFQSDAERRIVGRWTASQNGDVLIGEIRSDHTITGRRNNAAEQGTWRYEKGVYYFRGDDGTRSEGRFGPDDRLIIKGGDSREIVFHRAPDAPAGGER